MKYTTLFSKKVGNLLGTIIKPEAELVPPSYYNRYQKIQFITEQKERYKLLKETYNVKIYLIDDLKCIYLGSFGSLESAKKRFYEFMEYPEFTILKYA